MNDTSRPRLIGTPALSQNELTVARNGLEFVISPAGSSLEEVRRFLGLLDGGTSVADIVGSLQPAERRRFLSMVSELDAIYMLDDAAATTPSPSGEQLFRRLRLMTDTKADQIFSQNVMWQQLTRPVPSCPDAAAIGLAIESYYLWFHTAPLAIPPSYSSSPHIAGLLRDFSARTAGDEPRLLALLRSVGISTDDLGEGIPLPSTAALGLAASYWSHSDPLVFFAVLDALSRCLPSAPDMVAAFRGHGLATDTVTPPRASKSIGESIFAHIQGIGPSDWAHVTGHLELFFEMYDQYFTSIWNHYSTTSKLIRRVREI